MKITLYYNFHQEYFIEHGEVVLISEHDFPYDITLKEDERDLSVDTLYSRYRTRALEMAAMHSMYDYADWLSK